MTTSTMSAIRGVARERLRRRRGATLFLVLLAGLTAAAPMALWAASRQGSTAVGRFLERADAPDITVQVCPPGYDPAVEGSPAPCFEYRAEDELEVIRSLPHVEQAASLSFSPVVGGPSNDPATWRSLGIGALSGGVSAPTALGDPIVVAGRLAAVEASDELMVSEPVARSLDLEPGERLWLSADAEVAEPAVVATVVGVIRTPADLLPISAESSGGPPLFARAGWVRAHDAELDSFRAPVVWLDDGDVDGFMDRLRGQLGDQVVDSEELFPPGDRATLEQAIRLESRAGLATAAVAAVVVALFVGQAVSRQARSEGADAPTLLALGMTRRQLAGAAAIRWLPMALGTTALAVVGVLGASALGPFGVARRGPWDRAVRADWPVLVIGAVAIVVLVMAVAVTAAARRNRAESNPGSASVSTLPGSPGLRAGIGLAMRSLDRGGAVPLVSAVVATALAMAMVITAAGGAASLIRVTDTPVRFGVPWDGLVSVGPEDVSAVSAVLTEIEGVAAASLITGADVAIGSDAQVWTQALLPIAGVEPTRPVITDGREPVTDDEIALGSLTLRRSGAGVGDEISVEAASGAALPFRVVGVTMVTDGFEPNVGDGAVVTPGGIERIDPSAGEFAELGVRVVGGAGRDQALDELRAAFPILQVPFPVPASLANAERIAGLPLFLASGAAAVAAITLSHALIVSIRRNRRELAVCRVLGFTRGQVHTAVATQATLLATAAVVLGVPLGVAGARWGWRAISASFGVASGPVVPIWVVAATASAAFLVANLAAGPPALAAARRRPAHALRTE